MKRIPEPIFLSLRQLTRDDPEFVPAYFKLVEACKMYQEACASEYYAQDLRKYPLKTLYVVANGICYHWM